MVNQRQLNGGQQGSGSGLDADKVDGAEKSGLGGMTDNEIETMMEMINDIAENRFANSLSAETLNEIQFDTFVDQSKISSSSKVKITTGQNGKITLEDFLYKDLQEEDGDTSEYSGDTSYLSIYSGGTATNSNHYLAVENDSLERTVKASVTSQNPTWVAFYGRSNDGNNNYGLKLYSGGTQVLNCATNGDGNLSRDGNWHLIELEIDWSNNQYNIYEDGNQIQSNVSFTNNASSFDEYGIMGNRGGGNGTSSYDTPDTSDLQKADNTGTGTITSTQKDHGKTFSQVEMQQDVNLNGETVDYTVRDENGNTLTVSQSDIGNKVDASNLTGTKTEVDVNLSRSSGSTPECLEYGLRVIE